tara:strand:- start:1496 stop:1735 length:240 start_codon:yes stop_codon:yes gene_type:complete
MSTNLKIARETARNNGNSWANPTLSENKNYGMTKLEKFTMAALTGLCSRGAGPAETGEAAVEIAKSALLALEIDRSPLP